MRIPTDASPGLQRAFKELSDRLDRLGASTANTSNLNLRGQRATNAGRAEAMTDYTTLEQVLGLLRSTRDEIEAVEKAAREDLLSRLTHAAQSATAPAALADIPTWLAGVFASVR